MSRTTIRVGLVAMLLLPGCALQPVPGPAPSISYDERLQTPGSVTARAGRFVPLPVQPTDPDSPEAVARAFFESYRDEYRLADPEGALAIRSVQTDSGPYARLGMTHVRLRQVHQGLPIFGAEVVVHLDSALRVTSAGGRTIATPTVGTAASVDAETARAIALDNLSAGIVAERGAASLPALQPRLGIFVPALFGEDDPSPRLAFEIVELGFVTYVDASDGALLLQYDNVRTRDRMTHNANNGSTLPGAPLMTESQDCGIAGFDLQSPDDRALVFDHNGDGNDDLFFYRPGRGAAWVAESNGDGTFTGVYMVGDNGPAPPNGIAGYDLLSPSDRVTAFDYDGDRKDDLFLYRPGQGAAWVARSNGDGTFTGVHTVGDNGAAPPNGIAGYDLLSTDDRVVVFDFDSNDRDDLFLYRPGQGAAWVARSNGDATFTGVLTVPDNGAAPPNGIAGYDLLSTSDRVLAFNYDRSTDRRDDLFLYRPGQGAAWIARSNGDGTFTAVHAVPDNGAAPPNGIAGYDLLSASDRVHVFDFNQDDDDDLFLYRPGQGAAWVARSNGDGTFTGVLTVPDNGAAPPNGIAGYDLLSAVDQVRPFDFDGDGDDDLFLYRPGQGAAWVARSNGDGTFTGVLTVPDNGSEPPNGIAGYDLLASNDQALVLNFDGRTDLSDELFLYRPGESAAWIVGRDSSGSFAGINTVGAQPQDACPAHRFAGESHDYYFSTHGRNGFDGMDATIVSSVYYDSEDCPNAAWTGSQIWYCEGHASASDVVAHEFTHAVTQFTANLVYVNQSGALNESYSDVFAAMVDRDDWLIGENWPGGAIRDLCDPPAFGDPDHMSGFVSTSDDNGGVHTNSGIPNKVACLISEGGTHRGVTVNGVGRTKTEAIYFRTLTMNVVASSQFADAATQTVLACNGLVGLLGITTSDCTEVQNAFAAVGL